MAALRTAGDLAWDTPAGRAATRAVGEIGATAALATAMAAVGLTTRLATFRTLGLRPLWVGAGAALLVGAAALGLAAAIH